VITIHSYRVWDVHRGVFVVPPRKSTAEDIKRLGGEIIPGSADLDVVGAHGRQDETTRKEPSVQQTAPGRKPLFRSDERVDGLPHYDV